MTTALTALTTETHKKLEREGKVEQVSDPFIIPLRFGVPIRETYDAINREAEKYPDANAQMMGHFANS